MNEHQNEQLIFANTNVYEDESMNKERGSMKPGSY